MDRRDELSEDEIEEGGRFSLPAALNAASIDRAVPVVPGDLRVVGDERGIREGR
jgi:hypothetical protein